VRRFACALLLALLVGGCGSAAREAAPAKCVVHVFFCTKDLCERAATGAQMQRVEARLRERGDVYSLQFVSKKEALAIMRKRHPVMVGRLPANPFPDSLRVRPVKGEALARIAAAVRSGQDGVERVDYAKSAGCS
jgi:cell division protein FtsX